MENVDFAGLLVMPLLCVFFGLLIFLLGQKQDVEKGKAFWKWAGVAVLAIGAYSAWKPFSLFIGLGDSVESALYLSNFPLGKPGGRFTLAHYASFLLPVLAIVACVITHVVMGKAKSASE